jgi:hypothetical protein
MGMRGNEPQKCEADVDQEVSSAACDDVHTDRWHCSC